MIDHESLLARSTDVVSVVDADGVVKYQSPSVERVLGYDQEALLDECLLEYVHPEDREAVRHIFAATDSVGTERDSVEHRFRHADGSWVWLETRRSPDYDADAGGYVSTSRDVTRRKRTERERERLLDRMGDGFLGIDDDWQVTYLNDEAERLLDTSAEALVGEDVRESLEHETPAVFHDQYREAMTTQEPVSFESHVPALDATIEVRVFPSPTGLSVYFRDVTEARRIKRELERTVETLHGLHEIAAATDLTLAEKQSRLLETGRRHLDLPYGFVTRMTDDKQVIVDAVGDHSLLRAGNSCPIEESYCRKTLETDGLLAIRDAADAGWEDDPAYERFDLGSYVGGRIEVDGELYGTLCFAATDPRARAFTDSERSFVELAARWLAYEFEEAQYQRRLERQNERLDNFASILSHDLRNPLNVVQGRLDLAAERYDDEDLDAATAALDRTFDLIDDVLAFSRAGGDVLDPERIALPAVADRAWAIVDPGGATLDVTPDAGTVTADETRLQQLLENLFANSVEHGSTDGRTQSGDGVTVTLGPLDGDEGFYVADDGPGIPPERRERVFELGHTDDDDGSGLGLAIVREIADAHGWEVVVTESEAGGARFEVVTDAAGTDLPVTP
ncbi:PAS domain-containing sensor histidine kinase [Haloplanus halophilus]|uniref:PAS domain-containing sensor histidine kinase n=1 Tax=Haloplanus halophilus TaxID=2949993 RepID=UPI00203A8DE1|nr:PAS domain S-box protein [Haloplanus sp. GDY1]